MEGQDIADTISQVSTAARDRPVDRRDGPLRSVAHGAWDQPVGGQRVRRHNKAKRAFLIKFDVSFAPSACGSDNLPNRQTIKEFVCRLGNLSGPRADGAKDVSTSIEKADFARIGQDIMIGMVFHGL